MSQGLQVENRSQWKPMAEEEKKNKSLINEADAEQESSM